MDPQRQQELLAQLRGLQLPPEPGLWPPAPGWWLVAGFLVALAAGWFIVKRLRRLTWKKVALREHRLIASAARDSAALRAQTLADLSVLMRRVALVVHGRSATASQTDERWLATLDALSDSSAYSAGAGKLLQRHPYMRPEDIPEESVDALLQLTLETIKKADRKQAPSNTTTANAPTEAESVRL